MKVKREKKMRKKREEIQIFGIMLRRETKSKRRKEERRKELKAEGVPEKEEVVIGKRERNPL
jgi:hypothetical protein